MRRALKEALISSGLYGPLKRVRRRFFNREDMQHFCESIELYGAFISKGSLCFDIGCNVGDKAEVFLKLGANVIAFEPQPQCSREITARHGRNKALTIIEAAVGPTAGVSQMYVSKWDKLSSLVPSWLREQDVKETISVPVTTLDEAIRAFGIPDFCKIDVEGYEMEVLRGLSQSLPMLTLEYHLTSNGVQKIWDCITHLSRFGILSLNITRRNEPKFYWPAFVDEKTFRNRFPFPQEEQGDFGDVFIRII